jgi:hypothetical protein
MPAQLVPETVIVLDRGAEGCVIVKVDTDVEQLIESLTITR